MAPRSFLPLLASAAVLASCSSGISYQAAPHTGLPVQPSDAIYRVMHDGVCPVTRFASQTVIAPHWAVTNAHADGIASGLTAESRTSDLALVAIDGGAPLPFGTPHNGDHVTIYGAGCGGDQRVATGTIMDTKVYQCWGKPGADDPANPCKGGGLGVTYAMLLVANAGPGFSGGPIINDAGELVGVMEGEIVPSAPSVGDFDKDGQKAALPAQAGAILTSDGKLPAAGSGQAVAIGYSIQDVTAEFFAGGDVSGPVLASANPAKPSTWLERWGWLVLLAAI